MIKSGLYKGNPPQLIIFTPSCTDSATVRQTYIPYSAAAEPFKLEVSAFLICGIIFYLQVRWETLEFGAGYRPPQRYILVQSGIEARPVYQLITLIWGSRCVIQFLIS